jgi:hypothetical protein
LDIINAQNRFRSKREFFAGPSHAETSGPDHPACSVTGLTGTSPQLMLERFPINRKRSSLYFCEQLYPIRLNLRFNLIGCC